jgi:hypothetical protein
MPSNLSSHGALHLPFPTPHFALGARAGPLLPRAYIIESHSMGLNERRKIKELQEVTLPGRVKEIEEICGKPIAYEVDWDSLSDDYQALNFIDNLACHRLNMALRTICVDELGKEAVCEGLKLVKLHNVKTKEEKKMTFDRGVLEMHCAYALLSDGIFSDIEITELLNKSL